jgi:hypothetical protein
VAVDAAQLLAGSTIPAAHQRSVGSSVKSFIDPRPAPGLRGRMTYPLLDVCHADSPWPVIHAERAALADDLAVLALERWMTPSLCTGWWCTKCSAT